MYLFEFLNVLKMFLNKEENNLLLAQVGRKDSFCLDTFVFTKTEIKRPLNKIVESYNLFFLQNYFVVFSI